MSIARLCIDFASEEKLAEWIEDLRYHDVVPKDAAVFVADALDHVAPAHVYILKREGSRPDVFRLVIETTTVERKVV